MGSSGSSSTSYDPKMTAMYEDNYDTAKGLTSSMLSGADTRTRAEDWVAPLQQPTLQAVDLANDNAGNNKSLGYEQGTNAAGVAADMNNMGSWNYGDWGAGVANDLSGFNASKLGQTNLSPYMNQYTQAVADTTLNHLAYQNALSQQSLASQAATQGAYGGGRMGALQANQNRSFMDVAGKTAAGIYSDAFNNAQQAAQYDITNELNSANTRLAAGTLAKDSAAAQSAFDLGAKKAASDAFINAGNLQNSAGTAEQSRAANQYDLLSRAGSTLQDQQQDIIDVPLEGLSWRTNTLSGIPIGSSTDSSGVSF